MRCNNNCGLQYRLTPKVKILSDEVNIAWPRPLSALFQSVQWVVAAAKRSMFALGKVLVFGGTLGFQLEKPYCHRSAVALVVVGGVTSRVREAATGQHGSGCFPV